MRTYKPATLLLVFLAMATLSWAQSATTLVRGTITDPKGAVVVGASVNLADPANGFSRSTKSDESGAYQFVQIPPGTYNFTVAAPGFARVENRGVQLLVNTPTTVNFQMSVQVVATTVEVIAEAPPVNTYDATLGNAFNTAQIQALPFEGRDPVGILSLQPGVAYVGTAVNPDLDSRSGAVNGARSDQTNVLLDGIDNNDQLKGYAFQGALRATLDSLQEFRVTTSNANADAGRSSGAQVSLVTKSGTNHFHGTAYEYNRSSLGEANDWFNKKAQLESGLPNRAPHLVRNTFGATVGGPIVKDRAFFFLAYEGQRTHENKQITRVVPSDDLRNGIVSYICAASDPACPSSGIV